MKILCLDLGSLTGWALSRDGEISSGTWELATAKNLRYAKKLRMDRRLDIRVGALITQLETVHKIKAPDWVFFEDVRFGKSLAQVQIWSAFRGALWAFCHFKGIQIDCLDTAKLKKFATGSGAADKPAMARALCLKFPDRYRLEKDAVRDVKNGTLLDDNAVDALHLLDWARQLLK